jgi:nucleoside-diphosphate-sugar epimerase
MKVLITGMSGLIGGLAARALSHRHEIHGIGRTPVPDFPYTLADIGEFEQMRPAFDGIGAVIHMAGSRGDQPFDVHYKANITGTYNVLEASRQAGVKRVIMASSGAVIAGYEKDDPVRTLVTAGRGWRPMEPVTPVTVDDPVRPTSLYTATKMWLEAVGRVYAETHGLSVICIRVGKVEINDVPLNPRNASVWCSHSDIVQMIEKCVDAPEDLRYDVFFAVSDNPTGYRDWSHAEDVIGFTPQESPRKYGY